jgi:hypothetical protein
MIVANALRMPLLLYRRQRRRSRHVVVNKVAGGKGGFGYNADTDSTKTSSPPA